MVFYRKYRPQVIDDLDSEVVRTALQAIFGRSAGHVVAGKTPVSRGLAAVPHAFFFTGPKGLGKTSTARIVAKVVNCTTPEKKRKDSYEPCNECEQCKSITYGTNMDVLEIDAASNRGIDEIRDLREKIRLSPLSARKKVYIIDEVHMLTTEAFNALLKTLEEPPEHAMFVLCTTEPHKVPGTILSRCFHINFNRATDEEIVRSLRRVANGEKIKIDDDALYAIARMADGGFRDGAKILEEVSMLNTKITKELFEKSYKSANVYLQVANLLAALKSKDVKSGLEIVKVLVLQGADIRFFVSQVLADLHTKLLKALGVEKTTESESSLKFEVEEIKFLVELMNRAYQETKLAAVAQLPLELAIIEFVIDRGQEGLKVEDVEDEVTMSSLRKRAGTITKIKALYGDQKSETISPKSKTIKSDVELLQVPANGEVTKEWIAAFWKGLIEEMKPYNHTIAGVLRSCKIKNYDKKLLVIEAGYKFHKERLDDVKTREALKSVCKSLTGNDIEIAIELKKSS